MIELSAEQCRVIGVMLEKETTTPEQYPLSINALTNGCNQKSNREPVMSLSEIDVQSIVDELIANNQVMEDHAGGGRVNKYKHRFCNTPFGGLQLTDEQRAVLCVLFLRGAQTPGELRTRTNRLASFRDVAHVEEVLHQLCHFNDERFIKKLPREAGKRECRYIHLLSGAQEQAIASVSNTDTTSTEITSIESLNERVEQLEQQVLNLINEISTLKQKL